MSDSDRATTSWPIFELCTGSMSALFAFSALLQWNDPDPGRWIALYACAAGLALAPLFRPILPTSTLALAMVSIAWALSLLPGILAALAMSGTEEERELGGLTLVGGWMLFLFVRSARERKLARSAGS